MRIHVTGNAGAGKSTLAATIARELDLPLHGLDELVYQPGWKLTPRNERERKEMEICNGDAWVLDGVSRIAREKADLVVFLDVRRMTCLWRCARRNIPYLFRSRPGLPEKCPEILIIPRLVRLIWNFPGRSRKAILNEAANSTKYHVVTDTRQLEVALASIGGERSPS